MTQHRFHPGHEPWHALPEGFAAYLELESRLNEPVRQSALQKAALAVDTPPSVIIDIGSGTGADAVALAQQFPTARVHALDVSVELLDRVKATAAESGLADRIVAHRVDLNDDWAHATPQGADLAWASLSLHHLSDPSMALRSALATLRPGGVLVLSEQTRQGSFTPPDLGSGRTRLQERMTRAPSAHRSPEIPDWSNLLAQAGFTTIQHHEMDLSARADTADGARYLEMQLRSRRDRLSGDLSADDLADIDAAIDALTAGESHLSFDAGRGVWIAVRPHPEVSDALVEPGTRQVSAPAEGRSASTLPQRFEADVAVLGGGSAGLAAAIALARSRRKVVVIDAGKPRNAPASGAHNVLGQEGISPRELLARGRAEADSYGVRLLPGEATGVTGQVDDFTIEINGGVQHVHARRVILATGLIDDLPDIPGIDAGWGHTVLHCPFCHGWEVRDKRIAILARDEVAIHQALLFCQLSDRVTIFLHEAPDPSEEQQEQLAALGVETVRPRVERLVMDGADVRAVEIAGGRVFDADAVVVVPRFNARTELYEALGGTAETTALGKQIPADLRGLTEVPGVWAAGNASQPMAMVTASAASGVTTGAAVHADLAFAELSKAIAVRRAKTG